MQVSFAEPRSHGMGAPCRTPFPWRRNRQETLERAMLRMNMLSRHKFPERWFMKTCRKITLSRKRKLLNRQRITGRPVPYEEIADIMLLSICKEGVYMFLLQQTTSNNVPAWYTKRRTDFIRYTVILLLFLLLPCSSRMESEDFEIPCDNDIVTVETADSSGSRLTVEEVILEGKTGCIKSLHVFTAAEGRILVQTSGKTGYRYVWTGDGARTDAWKITGETGSLCALMRIGTTHHAAVRVTARKTSWATDHPDEEVYLWINAYNATNPAVIPASTARRAIAHGEMVSFETGIPNATVELWGKDGELITTAPADENGFVIFDSLHASDGADHYVSETFTYGLYDDHAATVFASDPAHLLPAAGGTAQEWVNGNDCATYQSLILTAAGFPVYTPYTNSTSSPGGSLRHVLTALLGQDVFKSNFAMEDFHEGDIVWGHNMGHVMYCAQVDPEREMIYVYGHSANPANGLSDNGWVSVDKIDAVMQLVTEENYEFEYRINGIADPRLITFEAVPGGSREIIIAREGSALALPENPFDALEHSFFAGWLVNGEKCVPGTEVTVSGHMAIIALWQDSILLGEADLVLPASLLRVEANAFEDVSAESVYIPDGCVSIGAGAFKNCTSLRRIRIPANCEVEETAFEGCSDVTVFGPSESSMKQFCETNDGFVFQSVDDW